MIVLFINNFLLCTKMHHLDMILFRSNMNRLYSSMVLLCCHPFRNCLPGTELLQSPFRTEFSMGSLLQQYQRSLRRHCRGTVEVTSSLTWWHRYTEEYSGCYLNILECCVMCAGHATLLLFWLWHHCKVYWNENDAKSKFLTWYLSWISTNQDWKLSSRNRVTSVSIHDPCGVIADFCGVIANFCGVIADPRSPAELPLSLRQSSDARSPMRRCRSLRNSLNSVKHC